MVPPPDYGNLLARFLLKMGLELLSTSEDVDALGPEFNGARDCARYGKGVENWNVGYGLYPDRKDVVISTREDEFGLVETRQIYEYSIGAMPGGDIVFFFAFFTHCFQCNLSNPDLGESLFIFNQTNKFSMQGRF